MRRASKRGDLHVLSKLKGISLVMNTERKRERGERERERETNGDIGISVRRSTSAILCNIISGLWLFLHTFHYSVQLITRPCKSYQANDERDGVESQPTYR